MSTTGILIDTSIMPLSRLQIGITFGDVPAQKAPLVLLNSNLPCRQEDIMISPKSDSSSLPSTISPKVLPNLSLPNIHTPSLLLPAPIPSLDTPVSNELAYTPPRNVSHPPSQNAVLSKGQNFSAEPSKHQVRWKSPLKEYQYIPHREDVIHYPSDEPIRGSPFFSISRISNPHMGDDDIRQELLGLSYNQSATRINLRHISNTPAQDPAQNLPRRNPQQFNIWPHTSSSEDGHSRHLTQIEPNTQILHDTKPKTTPLPLPKRSAVKRALKAADDHPNKLPKMDCDGQSSSQGSFSTLQRASSPPICRREMTRSMQDHLHLARYKNKMGGRKHAHTTPTEVIEIDSDSDSDIEMLDMDYDEDPEAFWDAFQSGGVDSPDPAAAAPTNKPQEDDSTSAHNHNHRQRKRKVYSPLSESRVQCWKAELDRLKYLSDHSKVTAGPYKQMVELLEELNENKGHPQLPELVRTTRLMHSLRPFRHKTQYGREVRDDVVRLWKYWKAHLDAERFQ